MTDEERLAEIVAEANASACGSFTDWPESWKFSALQLIEYLRAKGVTLTPPPAPEHTVTWTITTSRQVDLWEVLRLAADKFVSGKRKDDAELFARELAALQPDEVAE